MNELDIVPAKVKGKFAPLLNLQKENEPVFFCCVNKREDIPNSTEELLKDLEEEQKRGNPSPLPRILLVLLPSVEGENIFLIRHGKIIKDPRPVISPLSFVEFFEDKQWPAIGIHLSEERRVEDLFV